MAAILSIVSFLAFLWFVGHILRTRPYLFLILFLFLFAFTFRLINVLYIDVFGPIDSREFGYPLGPGAATGVLALTYAAVLACFTLVFKGRDIRSWESEGAPRGPTHRALYTPTVHDVAFFFVSLFLLALWVDFLRKGVIPLFSGLERYEYTELHGGPFHGALMDWGNMLAFQLGYFFAASTRGANTHDRRFLFALIAVLVYLFFAGHRFSAFYSYSAYFVMAYAMTRSSHWAKYSTIRELLRSTRR